MNIPPSLTILMAVWRRLSYALRPMQHVQGYTRSLIAPYHPVAAKATGKQTRMKEYTYVAGSV